jgi:hypothetical protein
MAQTVRGKAGNRYVRITLKAFVTSPGYLVPREGGSTSRRRGGRALATVKAAHWRPIPTVRGAQGDSQVKASLCSPPMLSSVAYATEES